MLDDVPLARSFRLIIVLGLFFLAGMKKNAFLVHAVGLLNIVVMSRLFCSTKVLDASVNDLAVANGICLATILDILALTCLLFELNLNDITMFQLLSKEAPPVKAGQFERQHLSKRTDCVRLSLLGR